MLFKQFYDEDLAQASYLVGCQANNTAVVVDPRRDIQIYLDEAKKNGMEIVGVTETHIHADYLSGSRELANATGATLYLSDEGDADWKYGYEAEKLHDGDEIKVGNIVLKAVHSPGHTPEHMAFLVTDGATTDKAGFLLSGDFVFVGDVGRPDLLDEAAGGQDTRFLGAKQMYASLRDKFLTLPDYVQVWPGHGAGSACGKALGAVPSSTVGYERLFSWWAEYLNNGDEEGFVNGLLEGQPDAPVYFGRMKRQNKMGPALLGERPALRQYQPGELEEKVNSGEVIFIDTRSIGAYQKGAVSGSINVPVGKTFASWTAWVIDPEKDQRQIVVLANDEEQAQKLRDKLSYVGIDNVTGYITSIEGMQTESVEMVAPEDLEKVEDAYILDVRTKNEFAAGHIPGANQLHSGRVVWNLEELPKDRPLVVHCQIGGRASVVASALRSAGFNNVIELEGSYLAWKKAQEKQGVSA